MRDLMSARLLLGAILTLALVSPSAAGRGWKTPPDLETDHMPELCERFDGVPASSFRLPGEDGADWPTYRLIREEVEFRVALDADTGSVRAILTEDAGFRTPEGVGIGMTLGEARQKGAGEPRCGRGWNCYATLPSGWETGFSTVRSNPETGKMEYRVPDDSSAVNSLLLRGECEPTGDQR